jgi:hypothetical protein
MEDDWTWNAKHKATFHYYFEGLTALFCLISFYLWEILCYSDFFLNTIYDILIVLFFNLWKLLEFT